MWNEILGEATEAFTVTHFMVSEGSKVFHKCSCSCVSNRFAHGSQPSCVHEYARRETTSVGLSAPPFGSSQIQPGKLFSYIAKYLGFIYVWDILYNCIFFPIFETGINSLCPLSCNVACFCKQIFLQKPQTQKRYALLNE